MAAMDELKSTVSGFLPSWGTGSGLVSIIAWLIIGIVFLVVVGVATFWIVRRLKFNKTIKIFEKINGRFEPTKTDYAWEMKHGDAGDTIFYLRKAKKKIPTGSIQTGRNTYWYFLRQDGELINFGPGDLDEMSRTMGAKFLDKEMRYARTQLQRSFKERYDDPGFWKQYGVMIMNLVYLIVLGMMIWMLFDKWLETSSVIGSAIEKIPEIQEVELKILSALDNLKSGGSGIVQA